MSKTGIEEWFEKTVAVLRKTSDICAVNAGQWARDNRSWTDRTGTARTSLQGRLIDDNDKIGFSVSQGVEYGKYLETAHDGTYAICDKAVKHFIPEIKTALMNASTLRK